jgi:hypothetical protein
MGRRGMHVGYWWESQKKRLLGRPRHSWVDNIKVDLRVIEWGGIYWIDLAQNMDTWRVLVNTTFRFHSLQGSSSVAAHLAVPQEGLSSMKLVG